MLTAILPTDLAARMKAGSIVLVDVREADERARGQIAGSMSLPLSQIDRAGLALNPDRAVVFHCRSGMRTGQNCSKLASLVAGEGFVLAGGLDGWKAAGLPVIEDPKAPLELMRQVQIVIGSVILAAMALAALVSPAFLILPALMGGGLLVAGLTGWCGLARLLALAPWNRIRSGHAVLTPAENTAVNGA
jgi:rhodanese-related sulfurtransferase